MWLRRIPNKNIPSEKWLQAPRVLDVKTVGLHVLSAISLTITNQSIASSLFSTDASRYLQRNVIQTFLEKGNFM